MNNRKYLLSPKIKTFGHSMLPLLHNGDVVYIKKKKFYLIGINDIVCVQKNNNAFTHRVIYKKDNFIITKGDNNKNSDGRVYPKNVLGVVEKVKRNGQILSTETLYLLQSTVYFEEILKVNQLLEETGINFVFLKGLPLHLFFEGSHPKRIYVDCDLLIKREDFSKVRNVFSKLGYKHMDTSLFNEKLKDKIEVSFSNDINGIPVVFDIHLEVVFLLTQIGTLKAIYPHKLLKDMTLSFLNERRIIKIEGLGFPILSNNNLILYLLLHLYHHNFEGTYRYDFILNLIRRQSVNYKILADTVLKYKLENFIYPGLLMLNKHYEFKIPAELNKIRPKNGIVRRINKTILRKSIVNESVRLKSGITRFRNAFYFSPNPLLVRFFIFLDTKVIAAILFVIFNKLRSIIRVSKYE